MKHYDNISFHHKGCHIDLKIFYEKIEKYYSVHPNSSILRQLVKKFIETRHNFIKKS